MTGKGVCLKQKTRAFALLLLFAWAVLAFAEGLPKIPVYLADREVWVEVARTADERTRGLMGRKTLGEEEGMLFIFETEGYHSFWMKRTLIPLSIAFIDREGKILRITDMEPLSLESHAPPAPILYALEMRQGWFSSHGLRPGDIMRFSK